MAEGGKQFSESDPGPATLKFADVLMCLVEVNTMVSGRKGVSAGTSRAVERLRSDILELFTEYYNKGAEACSSGDHVKAACYLAPACALEGRTFLASFKLAEVFRLRKEYDKSREILHGILEMAPQNAEAFRELGSTCVEEGNFSKGIEFLERATQLNPKDGTAHILLSLCYLGVQDMPQARRHAESARTLGVDKAVTPILKELSKKTGL
jgi:tetratricopeptide (TPR) repeat protein